MTETVELRGHAPAVQTVGGEVGMGVDTRTLRELPVIDRNPQQLVQLQTGVTPPFPMSINPPPVIPNWAAPALPLAVDPDRNRFFSTNGQMPWNNLWQEDGVNNEEWFRHTAIRVTEMPAVQQMNIETTVLGVPRGYTGGAEVTAITPSGTNGFHGDLYEFWSGNIIRSRDFFDTPAVSTPRFVYNQPGADFGGPISHDKTFLYGAYTGTFANGGYTTLNTVPSAAMLGGNFSAVPGLALFNPNTGFATGAGRTPFGGNVIPSFMLNPTAAAYARFFPRANLPGFFNNYQANAPFRDHQEKADGRLDHHFNEHTAAFLHYGYTNDAALQDSPLGSVIGASLNDRLLSQNAVADLTHAFTGALVTDFRFGYNRWDQKLRNGANQFALGSALGITGFNNNLPAINIAGFSPLGSYANTPEHPVENNFNWVWTWGWHHGRNNVKFGTDIRRIRADGFTDSLLGSMYGPNGTAYFTPGATMALGGPGLGAFSSPYNSFASFLLGAPTSVGSLNYLTTPTIRQTLYSAWLGDTIQVTHRLSLDFGARYDLFGAIQPRNPGGAMFFNGGANTFDFAGIGNTPMNSYVADKKNIAPRFGFAFRATSKTVVRGGYGIQYFQQPYSLMPFMPVAFGTFSGAASGFGVTSGFGPTVGTTVAPVTTTGSLVNGTLAGNLPAALTVTHPQTPYVQNFSFQVQQEFYWGTMLSLGYVGALGRHLPYNEELNAALPGAGVAGLPFDRTFGRTASTMYFNNGLTSNYNSLQASLTKRFARGVSFVAAYTYSKALGYTDNNNTLMNPFNFASNYGPLNFDRQSMLTISHLWELPFGKHGGMAASVLGGWQLNGMFTYATGTPTTVGENTATCACPGFTGFGVYNGGNPYFGNGLQVLNPAAFSAPGAGSFGNTSRGEFRSPGFTNYDMSLFKNFRIHDRFNVQLRGEAYNLLNTPHFAPAVGLLGTPAFGQQIATLTGTGRQVNLGFRLMF